MEFQHVNRNVLVIRPKPAMLDWINALAPTLPVTDMDGHDEATIYLIKETPDIESGLKWLRKNFKTIFAEELVAWWLVEADWPPLTWAKFEAFCHYRLHTCVYDTEVGGIGYSE